MKKNTGSVLGLWKSTDYQGTGEEMSHELAEMEDEDIQRDTRGSTTRSGRKSRRPGESSFLFYD